MSSRERRRWVIDRVVAKARRDRVARERSAGEPPPDARGARRQQPKEPRSK
jgi:hypothetical protein